MASKEDFTRLWLDALYVGAYALIIGVLALVLHGVVMVLVYFGVGAEEAAEFRQLSLWLVQLDKYSLISAAALGTLRGLVNLAGYKW